MINIASISTAAKTAAGAVVATAKAHRTVAIVGGATGGVILLGAAGYYGFKKFNAYREQKALNGASDAASAAAEAAKTAMKKAASTAKNAAEEAGK